MAFLYLKRKKHKILYIEFWVVSTYAVKTWNHLRIGQVIRLLNDTNFSETLCILAPLYISMWNWAVL